MIHPDSSLAKPVYVVVNEQGFSVGSTRVYFAKGTAKQVVSSKTNEWLRRKKQYEKYTVVEAGSWLEKAKEQYSGEPPKLTILEGTISWKEVQ